MQPTAVNFAQRSGDLGGRKTKMGVDLNSLPHLMKVLTDLYSDPEMAIIREYATNALDAQIEAGVKGPIKVFTPSSLSPFYRIIDRGVGLDHADIEAIYSQYGASTKRGTNEQTGMLGLGCKSALTYTNQFTVIGTKNGIKTSVMVSREPDGTGVMETLFEKPTDEPNGVEIVIPVRFSHTFESKVTKFFQYWNPDNVLVNDKKPVFLGGKGKKITNEIYLLPEQGPDVIVMGGVAYPVNHGLSGRYRQSYNQQFRVVAFVKIGDVNFTPAREELHYTELTNATIRRVTLEFENAMKGFIQADVDTAKTHAEAIEKHGEWSKMMHNSMYGITYKGQQIKFNYPAPHHRWSVNASRYAMDHNLKETSHSMVSKSLTVIGFEFDKVTTTQRQKTKRWMEENNKYFSHVLFTEEEIGLPWTEGSEVVDYADIKALRLPPRAPAGTRAKRVAKYDVVNENGYTDETDDIDDSQDIYYFSPAEYKGKTRLLRQMFPKDDVLVSIGKNRFEKFMRDFPNAKPVTLTLIKTKFLKIHASLTETDKTFLGLSDYTKSIIRNKQIDATRFDDPALRRYVETCHIKPSPAVNLFLAAKSALWDFGIYNLPQMNIDEAKNPFADYPLINNASNIRGDQREHVYIYCNAWYNRNKNK